VSEQADIRCPHCGALLRAGAEWCTLCYADLRPKPEPVAVGAPVDQLTAPHPTLDAAAPLSALEAAALAIVHQTAPATTPATTPATGADSSDAAGGWPCTGCEEVVSFEENACPTCGTQFLDGARGEPDLLDRIGPGGLPVSTQSLIIAGGAVAMIAIIVAAMYIIGMLL
jgi:RNA polymerase subunit RPABC4/transcription elongation factor Spt4